MIQEAHDTAETLRLASLVKYANINDNKLSVNKLPFQKALLFLTASSYQL